MEKLEVVNYLRNLLLAHATTEIAVVKIITMPSCAKLAPVSDEFKPPIDESLELVNPQSSAKRVQRHYTDEDRYIALAAVDLNGGNVYRTAKALDIPAATLYKWVDERTERIAQNREHFSVGEREKRGDLAAKMESVIHDIVESMPNKIDRATLSQSAVAVGVLTDKVRILRGQGLEPDPAIELCRILGINRSQLPATLQLEPGEQIPEEFKSFMAVIEMRPTASGILEPVEYTQALNSDLNEPIDGPSNSIKTTEEGLRDTNEKPTE